MYLGIGGGLYGATTTVYPRQEAYLERTEELEKEEEEARPIRRVPPRPQDRELLAELTRLVAKGVAVLF